MNTSPSPPEYPPRRRLSVGRWRVDAAADEIEAEGQVLKLEPQNMKLLLALAERAGDVITQQELLDGVWRDLVVTPNSVYQAVAQLRRQLGDSAGEPSYIQTVHRKGYRLVAPVLVLDGGGGQADAVGGHKPPMPTAGGPAAPEHTQSGAELQAASAPEPGLVAEERPEPASAPPQPAQLLTQASPTPGVVARGDRRVLLAAAVLAPLALAAGALWLNAQRQRAKTSAPMRIAVLPLVDNSPGGGEEALAAGLALDVLAALGRHADLQVVGPESVLAWGRARSVADAARALGVDLVLAGELVRSGSQLRVAVRLLRPPGEAALWQAEYRRPLAEAAQLPAQIARETLAALGLAAVAARSGAGTPGVPGAAEAYELYVLGQDAWRPKTPEAFAKAREYFQRGIDADPAFAGNYVGLGWSWIGQAENSSGLAVPLAIARATPLYDKALRLDPDSPDALAAKAQLHTYAGEQDVARTLLLRAIAISPSHVQAHHTLGVVEFDGGWPLRAIALFERAATLNPLNASPLDRLSVAQAFAGQHSAALASARKAVAVEPRYPNGQWSIGIHGYATGDLVQAVNAYRQALDRNPRRPYLWGQLAWLYLDLELPAPAEDAFARSAEQLPGVRWPAIFAALPWVQAPKPGAEPQALALRSDTVPEDGSAIDLMQFRLLAGLGADAVLLRRALDVAVARGEPQLPGAWFVFQGLHRRLHLAAVRSALGEAAAASADLALVDQHLQRLVQQGNQFHALDFHRARVAALRGQWRAALAALEAAESGGSRRGWWLRLDPAFAPLRDDRRFAGVQQRIGAHLVRQRQQLGF